jgi:ribonuclease BN (tRNA processing enzyme)
VYTGDTGPSDALGDWARGCDLLVAECSLPDAMALDIHLTPRQAGALAARAGAKQLVLTHLYPPVEAVDIVAVVAECYRGPVTIAWDGARFEI